MSGNIHEECGVFGIYRNAPSDVAHSVYFGLYALNGGGMKAVRPSLVAGALMSLLAVISLFCSISSGKFNFFGDIIILAMPVVYTLCMFSASDKL